VIHPTTGRISISALFLFKPDEWVINKFFIQKVMIWHHFTGSVELVFLHCCLDAVQSGYDDIKDIRKESPIL